MLPKLMNGSSVKVALVIVSAVALISGFGVGWEIRESLREESPVPADLRERTEKLERAQAKSERTAADLTEALTNVVRSIDKHNEAFEHVNQSLLNVIASINNHSSAIKALSGAPTLLTRPPDGWRASERGRDDGR